MKCKIDYKEHVDSKDQVDWIEFEIDDQVFIMDKGDVWNLYCISKSVFDKMVDVNEAIYPLVNRERVMKIE